ncbi:MULTISPECIES: class I SAM-dependent methyltransferase [Micrococcales]|uniref:class I SAM-dependent methyltransferase n=1 Tax=Micrococcales TaxID=85006 RepID=UPI00038019EC|nr:MULTISPECIES: class I SAM-dependent methyltransferase [Micrococcales]
MIDAIFSDPRLAALYDVFDGPRDDLDHYLDIVTEFDATRVLDIGCGTGSLALLAAARGVSVTGVDPASASLDVARGKPGADQVEWLHGDATCLPDMQVDLAVMTGNVAQVFLTDAAWSAALAGIRGALRPGGYLVFETRRPESRAWEGWRRDPAEVIRHVPAVGRVEHRRVVTRVDLPLVSFRHTYTFPDHTTMSSDSTLRFRDRAEVDDGLMQAGYTTLEVRQAPDRPGAEFVFIAERGH